MAQARVNPEFDEQALEQSHGLAKSTNAFCRRFPGLGFQSFSIDRLSAILAPIVLATLVAAEAHAQSDDPSSATQEAGTPTPAPVVVPPAPAVAPRTPDYAPPPTTVYTAPAPPPAHPSPTPDLSARARDAHVDRVLLLPTAETQPAGTTALSSYEIAIVQVTYAVNDSTQVSLTATPPIEGIVPLDLSIKSTIARGEGYRLAVFGGASGATGLDEGPAWVGRVGMVGQGCFDKYCRSSASMGASAFLLGPATFVATGAGVILRVSELFAILAEVDTLVPAGRSIAEYHGIVAGAGFRWSGRRWAVDGSLYRSLAERGPAVPFLAVSYRFLQ